MVWIQVKCTVHRNQLSAHYKFYRKKELKFFYLLLRFRQNRIRKKFTICGLTFPVYMYLVQTQVKIRAELFLKSHT